MSSIACTPHTSSTATTTKRRSISSDLPANNDKRPPERWPFIPFPLPQLLQPEIQPLILLEILHDHHRSRLRREHPHPARLRLQLDLISGKLRPVIPDRIEGLPMILRTPLIITVTNREIGMILVTGGKLIIKSPHRL